MVESTGQGEPTNAGAPNDGDVNTAVLDNLATKPSDSEPGSTASPPPAPDDTGQPQGETPPVDDGAKERLEQRLAQSNKVLASLGIDPDSDLAERFHKGLVSREELLLQAGITPTAPSEPQVKPASALDNLSQLRDKCKQSAKDGKGILESDVLEFMDAAVGVANENAELQNQSSIERRFVECRDATLNVIHKDSKYTEAPQNIKDIESQMFLSSTDNLVAVEGKGDPKSLTAQNYGFYADKNLGRLNTLRDYWIEEGKKMAAPQATKPPAVNPISPNIGSAPIAPPETPTTLDNLEERAQRYVQSFGETV